MVEGALTNRFLTFRAEGRCYALPVSMIAEIIRMQHFARVPHAPVGLLGLINLRGSVIPVASIRRLLGLEEAGATDASRLIVLNDSIVALAVDEVTAFVRVQEDQIKIAEADVATLDGEQLAGVFQAEDNVTKILDISSLLNRGFARSRSQPNTGLAAAEAGEQPRGEPPKQRLMTFEVAGQEYALPLQSIREIVPIPEHLTIVPHSDSAVRGVMPYRQFLLPLLSLRALLGFPVVAIPREKIVVVTIGDILVGLVADRANAVLSVDAARVEPTPPVLKARAQGEIQVNEILRSEDNRLISILAPDRLLKDDVMAKLSQEVGAQRVDAPSGSGQDNLRFLVFRLNDNEFALPIAAIDEVTRIPDSITRLPRTPKFLEGVVNLRGDVVPVIDQRRRFDMPPRDGEKDRRLIIVRSEHHRAALIVDEVTEVLRCSSAAIAATPDLTGEALSLVKSVINLETSDRIVLLLDPAELLSRTERGLLDAFAKRTKEARQTDS